MSFCILFDGVLFHTYIVYIHRVIHVHIGDYVQVQFSTNRDSGYLKYSMQTNIIIIYMVKTPRFRVFQAPSIEAAIQVLLEVPANWGEQVILGLDAKDSWMLDV